MDIQDAIRDKAIELKDETVHLLKNLISTETTDYKENNGQMIVIDFLEKLGCQIDLVQPNPEELKGYPEYNPGHTYQNRENVIGIMKGKSNTEGKSLLLHAHMDTVFPASLEDWETDPFKPEVIDGKLYGLGSADTKGSMATMLMAIKLVRSLGIELDGDIMFQSVVDEEAGGGNGSLSCLHAGYRTDGAIIGEPNNLNPMSAHVGSYAFRLIVEGKSAHANTKWKGVSAFEKAFPIIQALHKLEKKWNKKTFDLLPSPVITVVEINSGDGSITIPGRCEMLVNYTYLPDGYGYYDEIVSAINASIEDDPWFEDHKIIIEKHHDCGPYYNSPSGDFATVVKAIVSKTLGKDVPITGMACGADARLYANVGKIPTMIIGPGNIENAHQPNEFVVADELVKAVQVYASIIVEWCKIVRDASHG